MGISVSDGTHKFSKVMTVLIEMMSNHQPRALTNLRNYIDVTEGGEAILTTANIGATDGDTEDRNLKFVVIQSPEYGEIQRNGRPVKEFRQEDLWTSSIWYKHTAGEIGFDSRSDSVTFLVMDDHSIRTGGSKGPILDLNITIIPVDNAKPEMILGSPLFVSEGNKASLSFEILSAQDLDTPPEEIGFVVTSQPRLGYIENAKRRSGAEKRNAGQEVTTFNMADLKDGSIYYVSAHQSNELPEEDSFSVFVTDGNQHSTAGIIDVIIVPESHSNNLLLFDVEKLIVEEGGELVFDVLMQDPTSTNGDNHWMLSVTTPPTHGQLLLAMDSPTQDGYLELPLHKVSMMDMGRNQHLLYHHDNSETIEDTFTLKVTDGEMTIKKVGRITIVPRNDEAPHAVTVLPLVVNATEDRIITPEELLAMDEDNESDEIYFVLLALPYHGRLEIQKWMSQSTDPDRQEPVMYWEALSQNDNFTQDDVNHGRVRYIQTGELTQPSIDTFIFQLTDGTNDLTQTTFEIQILKDPDSEIRLRSVGLRLVSGGTAAISSELLSASDGYTTPEDLVYMVTSAPTQGYLSLDKHTSPVSQFSQMDLQRLRVTYTHTGLIRVSSDEFDFTVSNNQNKSKVGTFRITIDLTDRSPPSLDTNMALTVIQGDAATLTPLHLHITDPDTATDNLTYILIEPPLHGRILNEAGSQVSVFTQRQVDDGQIRYESQGSDDMGIDYFLFTITDNHHADFMINGTKETQPAFFNILIQPVTKTPPKLAVNKSPSMLEFLSKGKYGFILTDQNLRADHPISTSQDLIYSIQEKPQYGYLEHLGTGRPIKKRFSQKDLDDGRVALVLEYQGQATNDSFTFRIQDQNRNTLDNQR